MMKAVRKARMLFYVAIRERKCVWENGQRVFFSSLVSLVNFATDIHNKTTVSTFTTTATWRSILLVEWWSEELRWWTWKCIIYYYGFSLWYGFRKRIQKRIKSASFTFLTLPYHRWNIRDIRLSFIWCGCFMRREFIRLCLVFLLRYLLILIHNTASLTIFVVSVVILLPYVRLFNKPRIIPLHQVKCACAFSAFPLLKLGWGFRIESTLIHTPFP